MIICNNECKDVIKCIRCERQICIPLCRTCESFKKQEICNLCKEVRKTEGHYITENGPVCCDCWEKDGQL